MKKVSKDFLEGILLDTLIEYTKKRFISEEEFEDFKSIFLAQFENKLLSEKLEDTKTIFIVSNI